MISNIKKLYAQVEDKQKFVNLLSKEFDILPQSVNNNWFTKFWIPKSKQSRVVELLQNTIKKQNKVTP